MSDKDLNKNVDNLELEDEDDFELDDENNNSNNPSKTKDTKGTIELSDSLIERPESPSTTIPVDPEERDEEMEDFARQFKTIYETKFVAYLKGLKPNDTLNGTSLPDKKYNKRTYEDDSANSTTIVFYFDKLETDEAGNINAVVTKSFDKSDVCYFQPHLFKNYGPYFNTQLFCCFYNTGRTKDTTSHEFFLDLPIQLYNLIE